MLKTSVLVLFCVALAFAQDDLDSLFKEVFTNSDGNQGSNKPAQEGTGGNSCGPGNTCVPYYLCKKGSTIKDGDHEILDIKIQEGSCPNFLEVCCPEGDISKL